MDELIENHEMISTQELMKKQRKEAYEDAKTKRKEEKRAQKAEMRRDREKKIAENDKKLWEILRPASEVELEETLIEE